jgi:hypothetical protein
MTFKDTPVIMSNNEVNEGLDDVLENIELQSTFKQKMFLKRK